MTWKLYLFNVSLLIQEPCDLINMEAKIWNKVFEKAEKMAGIERGSIRATVLIETLPAVFQMNEILYELRDHSVGLNCDDWDYIFSYVKTFHARPDRLLPDRVQVGMSQHFMKSYSDLLIRTCHRCGVHPMGGMVCNLSYLRSLIMQRMFLWNLIRCMYKTLFVLPVHIRSSLTS